MARKNDCWGIEVGQYALKAIRLIRSGDRVEVADWDVLPFKQVLSTPDLNVDEAIQVNLDAFLAKHPEVDKSQVVVSVPGHMAFARFAKLPPVEPKMIPNIVSFEAAQQIPFPIEQVEWDYQVFQQEDSPDVEVGIFAITKERVMEFLTNYRSVGIRIDALTLSPLAVYNAFAYDNGGDDGTDGTVYMDIGTTSTDVVIVESGGIWLRTLPIGGNNFTEALVKSFKISFPKAEKHKREAGTSKYSRQIFSAMRPVFADLVQEIQRSIGYYQSLNRDAQIKQVVCIGSTFKLPGLSKFLKQQLQLKVIRPDNFKRLHVEGKQESEFSSRVVNLATAYGLALQGIGLEQVSANVLPAHIVKQRMWKAKQPWIGAAAACVALGAVLAGGRYYMDHAAWVDQRDKALQVINPIEKRAQNYVKEYKSLESEDKRKQIENLRRGLDYRNIWTKLQEDISSASLATEPQSPTVGADYKKIVLIKRSERKRVYISQIQTAYRVGRRTNAESSNDLTMQIGRVHKVADFWSKTENDNISDTSPDSAAKMPTSPHIVVIVSGSTPYLTPGNPTAPPTDFLYNKFIRHLYESASQQDRPYRILIDWQTTLRSLSQNVEPVAAGGAAGRGGSAVMARGSRAAPRRAVPPPTRAAPPATGGAFGVPGDLGMAGGAAANAVNLSLEALYPQRPLADEDTSKDWHFEIEFVLELLPPKEARQSENRSALPESPPESPPESSPESSPTTPADEADREALAPRKEVDSWQA